MYSFNDATSDCRAEIDGSVVISLMEAAGGGWKSCSPTELS